MRRFRKATISDVARQAKVSITTVSVFASGRESVCSPETAERIRAAIAELHYTPGSHVRGLQHRANQTLGLCLHRPADPAIAYGASFFQHLWSGIMAQADQEAYALLHYPSAQQEKGDLDAFLDGRVDGVLLHSHHAEENRAPLRFVQAKMPVVLLTRSLEIPDECGAAWADETVTTDLALSHLWALGHRRIAHIAGPVPADIVLERYSTVEDIAVGRLEAYKAWMREHGLYDPALIAYAHGWRSTEHVTSAVAKWATLRDRPTAIFCANDALAIAAMEAAQAQGLSVPDDLSVVGVDNSIAALDAPIPVTSIPMPVEAIGRAGVTALIRLMQGAPLSECRIKVEASEIVTRASTAAVPKRKGLSMPAFPGIIPDSHRN